MELIKTDLCVIGGGSGGLSVAAGATQLGAKVVLIEANKMGGECLNYGCIPSKALLAAAKRANVFRNSEAFGIQDTEPIIDFEKLHHHIKDVISSLSFQDSVERFENLGVRIILERARFLSPTLLQAGHFQIQSKYYIIATGSKSSIPPLPGIDKLSYLTNETIFDLKEKPQHLIVVGGGPIGCELAQAYQLLGVKTTLIEAFSLLPKEDKDIVNILRKRLESNGMEIFEDAKILSLFQIQSGFNIQLQHEEKEIFLQGSHLLMATGRKPNVNDLGLEKALVDYTPRGIKVDGHLRTSNKRIFAIGDVLEGYQFTHIANYHATIVLKNCLFHLPSKVNYTAVPWVTYTDPEIAHVGMLTKDLPSDSKILFESFKNCDRAHTEREIEGFIRVATTPKGHILGVSIIGMNAGELILPWSLLITKKLKIRALTELIVPYPTLSEINKKVAISFYQSFINSSFLKKILKFFMQLVP